MLYPPVQPLRLHLLACHLGPYHYVLHPYILYPCTLHSHALYLLARSLAFDAYTSALALHALGPPLVLYTVRVRALVLNYFRL